MPTLLIIVSHLVEIIFVQLPDEAGEVTVFEMLWEN